MKILNQHIARMYVLTIILLTAFDIVSSYNLRQVPYALIIAVVASMLVEIAITKLYLKQNIKIPFSAMVTGLIIGSVAPINAPLMLVLVASLIAIVSKFFIRIKSTNILNPATIGLLVALAIFGVGDQWWAASSYNVYGLIISFTPLFIIGAYEARRMVSGLSYVIITLVLSLVLSKSGNLALGTVVTLIFSINYLFAFVMVADPKTSPHKKSLQVVFGGSVALISALLLVYGIPYALLIALLIANIGYGVYRIKTGTR